MNTKTLIGGIIAAVISFLLGWLIYGTLLMDYFNSISLMDNYTGLIKDPPVIWEIGIANLCWGLLTAYVFNLGGIKSVSKGAVVGLIIFLLSTLGFDLMMHAQMNLSGYQLIAIDVAISAIMGAIVGAVVGWWFGRGAATAS